MRSQEYTEELYKKDLHDPDNHRGVITHLEPDILEREVKWALGSITMNKPSGNDGILVDDAMKVLHSICQQIWKLNSGHRTGKDQFSFQSLRKAILKNVQTAVQLHSSLRISYSSSGIPSPPLPLFIVMLPKAHLTSHSRMSGSR